MSKNIIRVFVIIATILNTFHCREHFSDTNLLQTGLLQSSGVGEKRLLHIWDR
jgi:hypothetical protein